MMNRVMMVVQRELYILIVAFSTISGKLKLESVNTNAGAPTKQEVNSINSRINLDASSHH